MGEYSRSARWGLGRWFLQPSGRMVCLSQLGGIVLTNRSWVTIREGLVRRLADLGLLSEQEVRDLLPDLSISEPWIGNGESLMVSSPLCWQTSADSQYRLASTPKSHLDAFAFTITHSPGAARSFASEIIQVSFRRQIELIKDNTSLPNISTTRKSLHQPRLFSRFASLYSILLPPYDFPGYCHILLD